jgi:membrane associated rhomboid family serine protease
MLPLKDDQPHYSFPFVNWSLIVINVLIYLYQFLLQITVKPGTYAVFLNTFGEVPSHLSRFLAGSTSYSPQQVALPLFTSMFLHGSWTHVLLNMWGLYIFGDNVEDYLGHFKYLIFYVTAGLFAMATQVAVYPHSTVPTVGASGAIAGIMGAYFILYPRARVLTWIFELLIVVIWLPAWIILGYWFFLNILSGTETALAVHRQDMGGVAVWAHIGGFIAGMLMIKLFPERQRRSPYAYR